MNIGEVIRIARITKRLSQGELAKKIGKSTTHVCNIETGKGSTTVKVLEKIAAALDTDLLIYFKPKTDTGHGTI
jgi:transcriptional regulator with XRE-family HTH domain